MGQIGLPRKAPPSLRKSRSANAKSPKHPIGGSADDPANAGSRRWRLSSGEWFRMSRGWRSNPSVVGDSGRHRRGGIRTVSHPFGHPSPPSRVSPRRWLQMREDRRREALPVRIGATKSCFGGKALRPPGAFPTGDPAAMAARQVRASQRLSSCIRGPSQQSEASPQGRGLPCREGCAPSAFNACRKPCAPAAL